MPVTDAERSTALAELHASQPRMLMQRERENRQWEHDVAAGDLPDEEIGRRTIEATLEPGERLAAAMARTQAALEETSAFAQALEDYRKRRDADRAAAGIVTDDASATLSAGGSPQASPSRGGDFASFTLESTPFFADEEFHRQQRRIRALQAIHGDGHRLSALDAVSAVTNGRLAPAPLKAHVDVDDDDYTAMRRTFIPGMAPPEMIARVQAELAPPASAPDDAGSGGAASSRSSAASTPEAARARSVDERSVGTRPRSSRRRSATPPAPPALAEVVPTAQGLFDFGPRDFDSDTSCSISSAPTAPTTPTTSEASISSGEENTGWYVPGRDGTDPERHLSSYGQMLVHDTWSKRVMDPAQRRRYHVRTPGSPYGTPIPQPQHEADRDRLAKLEPPPLEEYSADEVALQRYRLRAFYSDVAPEKTMDDIDDVLRRYGPPQGYQVLWRELYGKYGPTLAAHSRQVQKRIAALDYSDDDRAVWHRRFCEFFDAVKPGKYDSGDVTAMLAPCKPPNGIETLWATQLKEHGVEYEERKHRDPGALSSSSSSDSTAVSPKSISMGSPWSRKSGASPSPPRSALKRPKALRPAEPVDDRRAVLGVADDGEHTVVVKLMQLRLTLLMDGIDLTVLFNAAHRHRRAFREAVEEDIIRALARDDVLDRNQERFLRRKELRRVRVDTVEHGTVVSATLWVIKAPKAVQAVQHRLVAKIRDGNFGLAATRDVCLNELHVPPHKVVLRGGGVFGGLEEPAGFLDAVPAPMAFAPLHMDFQTFETVYAPRDPDAPAAPIDDESSSSDGRSPSVGSSGRRPSPAKAPTMLDRLWRPNATWDREAYVLPPYGTEIPLDVQLPAFRGRVADFAREDAAEPRAFAPDGSCVSPAVREHLVHETTRERQPWERRR